MRITDDELEQHLYRREKGGNWYLRDQRGGADFRRSLRTRTKAQARKLARPIIEQRNALLTGDERVTFQAAAASWLENALPETVKPSTATRYLVSAKCVDAFVKTVATEQDKPDLFVDDIRLRHINQFVRWRLQTVNKRTVRNDLTAFGEILGYAVSQEWREAFGWEFNFGQYRSKNT